ncbi:MAG: ribonuclease J [Clostridia bacterium]
MVNKPRQYDEKIKENRTKQREQNPRKEEKNSYTTRKNTRTSVTEKRQTTTVRRTRSAKKETSSDITKFNFKKSNLKIIPLGGLQEIGKNITVFEYENEIILVDCGLEFPGNDMLGVDLVIPDISYLLKNQEKVKALIITHGHEDHIGAIPYILKQINIPIYATKLTVSLIKNKLEEHNLLNTTKLITVEQGQTINFENIQIEFINSNHSIPDSVMLAINTPVGTILHTGDFKIDYTPIDDKVINLGRIAELGNKGILALLSDSTNSERKGFTMSESSVGEVFDRLFLNNTKRIVVATFASNVHRVQQIVNSSVKYGRKIAICGRSMMNMIEAARELGYIQDAENIFIDIDNIKNYRDDQLVIITTGSQGEAMSALTRMANGDHKKVTITPNDMVIISATPIPGNEKYVSKVIDDLMKIGAEVIYSSLEDVHVSGHACQEEQKLIITLAKPKYFIPVHGEYRQLMAHAETAKKLGIEEKNIFMMTNGRVLELNENEAMPITTVPNGKVLVDGLGVGDVGNIVLRDRQHLSQDGLIVIVMTMDSSTGEIISGPDVVSRGFVYVRESENLMEEVKRVIREEVRKCEENHIRDWATIKSNLKDNLRDYIFEKTKRNPMILPIITEV